MIDLKSSHKGLYFFYRNITPLNRRPEWRDKGFGNVNLIWNFCIMTKNFWNLSALRANLLLLDRVSRKKGTFPNDRLKKMKILYISVFSVSNFCHITFSMISGVIFYFLRKWKYWKSTNIFGMFWALNDLIEKMEYTKIFSSSRSSWCTSFFLKTLFKGSNCKSS